MMTSAEERIGRESADEIKAHPFFNGIDWNNIREWEPPFVPALRSIIDTSYFPTEDLDQVPQGLPAAEPHPSETSGLENGDKKDLAFVGYTFSRFDMLTKRGAL
jgi:protein-serine/threonine kinase